MTPRSTQDLHNSTRGLKFNTKMINHLRFWNMMPQTNDNVRDVAQEPFFLSFLRDQEFRSHHKVFHTFFSTLIFSKNGNCQYITITHE